MPPDGVIPGGPSFVGTPAAPVEPVGAPASADGFLSVPGGPGFAGQPQPPDVPCDPVGDDWRGPPGPPGPAGEDGKDGAAGGVSSVATGAGLSGGPITTTGTLVADWHAGVVAALGSNLTLTGGTLDAKSGDGAGTVSNIATTGPGISGGPITTTGTLAVQWNAGAATSVGTGLQLAGGVLSSTVTTYTLPVASTSVLGGVKVDGTSITATGGGVISAVAGGAGTVTKVDTSGAGISGGPITSAGTLTVQWNAGATSTIGTGLSLAAGTLKNSGVTTFNGNAGAVTLTSGDVTTALTFTPYNATNPSGYQTAANVTTTLAPYALTSALPAASSTTPLVESGAGAAGTGTTFARADHVHPAAAGGGGIPEAPVGGAIYGRQGSTASWLATLPLTGGMIDGSLTVQKTVALSGNSDLYFAVGDATTARNQPLTYSYTAGSASGAISYLGWNIYANSSGVLTRPNTAKGGWFFQLDNRDAGVNADLLLRNVTNAGVVADRHTFGATGNFTITNNMQVGGVYRTSGGVQVMQARIGGWGATAPVNGVRVTSFDASTATLTQVAQALAALLVDLRTHGMIGT